MVGKRLKEKILVFDDDPDRTESWSETLNKIPSVKRNFQPISMKINEFNDAIDELMTRQSHIRKGDYYEEDIDLDKTAIFMIDFNLLDIEKGIKITGENAAYLTRCFSTCKLIIGINKSIGATLHGDNTFDLTLKRHPESYCDLNIGSGQLKNQGLWDYEFKDFRPWYWPIIPRMLDQYERRIHEIIENIETPICEVFDISDDISFFPDSVNNYLGGDPSSISFLEFALTSEYGIYKKDENTPIDKIARMAASKISHWLEYIILQRQDILIDAPHLVSRYPSLLIGEHDKIETWNAVTKIIDYDKLNLDQDKIEDYRFKKDYWISRPVWFWEKLSENENIQEVKNPWEKEDVLYNFCEDSSIFLHQDDCREFTLDIDTPYIRRYIRKELYDDVEYRPRVKLLTSIE